MSCPFKRTTTAVREYQVTYSVVIVVRRLRSGYIDQDEPRERQRAAVWGPQTFSHLDERPLYLTDVDGRVDASPDVHEDVCPDHLHVPGEAVHLHLARCHALRLVYQSVETCNFYTKNDKTKNRTKQNNVEHRIIYTMCHRKIS